MGAMPERPSVSPDQNSSAVLPMGVRAPSPVTTTRRPAFTGSGIVLDVLDGVAHGHDLLGVLVGNLDVEVLLERHDQLHRVEGIGTDRKSTRLNSSHVRISYAVFCLK